MAKRDARLDGALRSILNNNSNFLLLGAVSPDLPYLAPSGTVKWADVMHYEKTNSIVITGHSVLKTEWGNRKPSYDPILAWLFGYVSHLVADATVHPVVQEIVGTYSEKTKNEHRICEMTEDALIFKKCTGMEISGTEYTDILKNCGDSPHYQEVTAFWKGQLTANFWAKGDDPHPGNWYEAYNILIDVADGGTLAYACRHIGFGGFVYKTSEEIIKDSMIHEKYYLKAKLPGEAGTGNFKDLVFDKAVNNVVEAWRGLYEGITSPTQVTDYVKMCHLDTGELLDSPGKEVYYWT